MNNHKKILFVTKRKLALTLIPDCRRSDLNIPKIGETCTELFQSASRSTNFRKCFFVYLLCKTRKLNRTKLNSNYF